MSLQLRIKILVKDKSALIEDTIWASFSQRLQGTGTLAGRYGATGWVVLALGAKAVAKGSQTEVPGSVEDSVLKENIKYGKGEGTDYADVPANLIRTVVKYPGHDQKFPIKKVGGDIIVFSDSNYLSTR